MKKSSILLVLLFSVFLTIGLIFLGCEEPCTQACWARNDGSGKGMAYGYSTCQRDQCTAEKHSHSGISNTYDVKCDCY